jgi:lipoprotein-anchoring transpeptidase ErfK/SrfK
MSAHRLLALSYLCSASIFIVAGTLAGHPQPGRSLAQEVRDFRKEIATLIQGSQPSPVVELTLSPEEDLPGSSEERTWAQAHIVPPPVRSVRPPEQMEQVAFSSPMAIAILPDLTPAPTRAQIQVPEPALFAQPQLDDRAPMVAMRLKAGLTPEMLANFDLFLYVSKADKGPLSQRLYVFEKGANGQLKLAYDWPASTGRERQEASALGERDFTTTPKGYYELDPRRMYRSYHSTSWDQDMPYAMFFNWEREGLQTGLAIHAATGSDIEKLGSRASAGCVHLAPKNAAMLFDLIQQHYRGPVPRLAYDGANLTLSNQGRFMHDANGRLAMTEGYRVLIRIEDYGGADMMAALF